MVVYSGYGPKVISSSSLSISTLAGYYVVVKRVYEGLWYLLVIKEGLGGFV